MWWRDGVVGDFPLGVDDVFAGSLSGFFDLGAGSSEGLVVGVSGSVEDEDGGGAVERDDVFFELAVCGFEGAGSQIDCSGFALGRMASPWV